MHLYSIGVEFIKKAIQNSPRDDLGAENRLPRKAMLSTIWRDSVCYGNIRVLFPDGHNKQVIAGPHWLKALTTVGLVLGSAILGT